MKGGDVGVLDRDVGYVRLFLRVKLVVVCYEDREEGENGSESLRLREN